MITERDAGAGGVDRATGAFSSSVRRPRQSSSSFPLTYYWNDLLLSADALDTLPDRNHQLYAVAFMSDDAIPESAIERFVPVSERRVIVEPTPPATKLAFLSVVHEHSELQLASALGNY